jgi:hypothetical protein
MIDTAQCVGVLLRAPAQRPRWFTIVEPLGYQAGGSGILFNSWLAFSAFITDLNPDRSRCHLAMREASAELRFDAINQRHGEEIGKKLDAAGFPDRLVNRDQVFLERQGDRLGGEAGYHFAD